MSYESFAQREFRAAGWVDEDGKFKDEMQEAICSHILDLLKIFSDEGHSGSTAPYTVNLFKQLALFEPIVPLTGEDWEWKDVSHYGAGDPKWQNIRCGHVFKDANGNAWDSEGRIFFERRTDEDGGEYKVHFTSRDSHVPITFPYTPKREYVEKVPE